jgi:hypothetical protein
VELSGDAGDVLRGDGTWGPGSGSGGALGFVGFPDWTGIGFACASTSTFIEARTSDPSSPVVGQIWLRTDL